MTPEELTQLMEVVTKAADEIETRLTASLNSAIEGINSKIDLNAEATAALQAKAKSTFDLLPNVIKEKVENQLQASLTDVVEQVGNQFEEKLKALAGGGGDGKAEGAVTSLSLKGLLDNADKLVPLINAFRSPTTDQAMAAQMGMIFKWHGLLSKIEKGGSSGDEITKAIQDSFGAQP